MRRARGFTLLELAVGLGLAVIVTSAAVAVMANVLLSNKRQRLHSELQRDAEFVGQLLTQDLRQAGLGVPSGVHVQDDGGTPALRVYGTGSNGTATDLPIGARRVLVAGADEVGILGDLARPDSNYAVFGPLANNFTGSARDSIAWHNESNGTCVPTNGSCSMLDDSTFFAGSGASACSTAGTEETCPWGLRRLAVTEPIQIVDGRGNWSHSRRAAGAFDNAAHNRVLSMQLGRVFDFQGNNWQNDSAGAGPAGFNGQGWVTTLDRVFYRTTASGSSNVIERNQCFGDPDPNDADWPSGNAVPASPQGIATPVTAPVTSTGNFACTGWETVARNVSSVAFSYFDGAGAAATVATAADRDTIRRIEWVITFQSADIIANRPVTYTLMGAVALNN